MSALDDLRPVKHAFVEQPGTDECGRCSMPFAFGALHPEERGEFDTDDPQPSLCACGHYSHSGPCWGGVPSYPRTKPCECTERAS